jgi:bleomycin hydrolase
MLSRIAVILLIMLCAVSVFPADNSGTLTPELIKKYQDQFNKTDHSASINAITNNDIKNLALDRNKMINRDKIFNMKLTDVGITDQKSSGRCWLFATLNSISPKVAKKLKQSSFSFSQPYLTFWDKIEKANFFLECIIETAKLPLNDRKMDGILGDPFGDGGWWTYSVALMEKYGTVPLSAMPETKQSISTGNVNALAGTKLRAFAVELRSMYENKKSIADLRSRKEAMLQEIYQLLAYNYGVPPTEFVLRLEPKDSTETGMNKKFTPMQFYKEYVADLIPQTVVLMANPSKTENKSYQFEYCRNVFEKPDMKPLNLPIDKFKNYCRKTILDSLPVVFFCDVGADYFGDSALLVKDIYAYKNVLGIDFTLTKAQRILYRQSSPNHGMVFMGIDTASDGKPIKWLVENSWGSTRGDKGYLYMDDDWFNEYVYNAIIDIKYLSPEDRALYEQKPEIVPIWDPFSSAFRQIR